ncbi:MAG: phosphoribosylanthranilate isomerase [Candidatus Omnitrophota bacterium]|nr:phosphoribosylanthranilate isomerase [Candidatus Omnitrophota bacterium]
MWVKICGMTNREDAIAAAEAGADAIGFVLVPTSPRAVTRREVEEILRFIPPTVLTVGVVANEDPDFLKGLVRVCSLGALQLHGQEPPEQVLRLKAELSGVEIIKAIRVRDADSLKEIPSYKGVDAILLDTYDPHRLGGTGQPFDWSLAARAKEFEIPLIVAGGLTAGNVREMVRQVDPHGVDVSSGVEVSPGKKSFELIRQFVLKAK